MQSYKKIITRLLAELEYRKILNDVTRIEPYPDEPKIYSYNISLNGTKNFSDGTDFHSDAGGFSFKSRQLALLKCLIEAIERFCSICYRDKNLFFSTFNNLKNNALDPSVYTKNNNTRTKIFGWVKGFNLINNQPCLIPAQLIYYNYSKVHKEPFLIEMNSTGAAGGFDYESTLLRGIYEIVERDAFLTVYLAKIDVPRIEVESIKDPHVKKMVNSAQRYNLELMLFDLTNDLKIPSFAGAVVDRTGLGPSMSFGLKSALSPHTAIIGALEEAFHTRPWLKGVILKNQANQFKVSTSDVNSILERGLLWLSPAMFKKMAFLINKQPKPLKGVLKKSKINKKEELEKIKNIFALNNMNIFWFDITLSFFKKIGILSYKAVIPELQHLYLHETRRSINLGRIKTVASHFGKTNFLLNSLPHPFL